MKTCPCGSGEQFNNCCNKYISGQQKAATPEDLMRSRYSAYSIADISYIKSTMRGKASHGYDENSAANWAKTVEWLDLSVLETQMEGTDKGFVEFIARYCYEEKPHEIHERSEFHKIEGSWYYVDGHLFSESKVR